MANFTKRAIRDSFVKLLNKKPLHQISVRDIVEDCGVNRNTFYYYYHDIPQLVEEVVNDEIDRIIREHPAIDSVDEGVNALIGFTMENRRAVLHIYQSVNRDIFEKHYWKICDHVVTALVGRRLEEKRVSGKNRQMFLDYAMCVCFGVTMGWLNSGMKSDIQEFSNWLFGIKQGTLEEMITRCEKNKN